jgi:CHAD domain-containing protein
LKSFESKSQDISRVRRPVKQQVNPELASLAPLTAKLKANLALCVDPKDGEPSVDAVHDVRTGTRRIEAVLDAIASSLPVALPPAQEPAALPEAIARWQRLLKKIRRSAGAIRDLDVHRHLLRDFLEEDEKDEASAADSPENPTAGIPEPEPENLFPLKKQAEDLDAWLRHARRDHCGPLVDGAKKWMEKLDASFSALQEAMPSHPGRRRVQRSAAVTALEAFARLSGEMQQLYAENLHDFRKGAKKARYMAETAPNDEYAGAVGKALKKLQDEIGDWHDWLVLSEEAHRALGDQGAQLIARLEYEREEHYKSAMKTAERMRGRLMGEWRASAPKPRRPARQSAAQEPSDLVG